MNTKYITITIAFGFKMYKIVMLKFVKVYR